MIKHLRKNYLNQKSQAVSVLTQKHRTLVGTFLGAMLKLYSSDS